MYRLGHKLILSPSDLVSLTACTHLVGLEHRRAIGALEAPSERAAQADALARRGIAHERAYLQTLRAGGKRVVEIESPGLDAATLAAREAATLTAMRAGVDVIYQAAFFDGAWRGQVDFLERVATDSALGSWSYEPVDTKLSRAVKPAAILQLTVYAEQVGRLQGRIPTTMHVLLGDSRRASFATRDFLAYTQRRRRALQEAVAAEPRQTYPHPLPFCPTCKWRERCDTQRRADDHLSLVAGMRRDHAAKLTDHGVTTLAGLATSTLVPRTVGIGASTLERLRAQAALQLQQRSTGAVSYALLPPLPGEGLSALPSPSAGDVFFDMEGDPFMGDGGLEYLFGVVTVDTGTPIFRAFWAHDRHQEKQAFEAFIDWTMARRRLWPDLHIYHYAAYEATALGTLATRHGTREDAVDSILRGHMLVDLYRVVRQALRASTESYSIKKLEPLYMQARAAEVKDATSSIVAYERYIELLDNGAPAADCAAVLQAIALYNEEDCRSTYLLRDWLEARRKEVMVDLERPQASDGDASEAMQQHSAEVERRVTALCAGIPDDAAARTQAQGARWLLAQLLDWHRREAKPDYWMYYRRLEMTLDELSDDTEALGDLTYAGTAGTDKRSLIHAFHFDPHQEHKILAGKQYTDPATQKTLKVHSMDRCDGVLTIKAPTNKPAPTCRALMPPPPVPTDAAQRALAHIATAVINDAPGVHRAVLDLLMRVPPRLVGAPLTATDASVEALRDVVMRLDHSYLPVQGPPGAGKTYVGARMAVSLVAAGHRVALTANSHRVISNMLREIMAVAAHEGVSVRAVQKVDGDDANVIDGVEQVKDNGAVEKHIADGTVDLLAGTSWLMARETLRGAFHTLFIDEAGQLALANVVAVSTCARNLVLLGDPRQLSQPAKGQHPEGAGVSGLDHVLHKDRTITPERGVFLPTTRRMHPSICALVSDVIYEGKLHAHVDCARQRLDHGVNAALTGAGLRWLPVEHLGRATHAPEEVRAVTRLLTDLLGCTWTDQAGRTRPLALEDVLIVAPFNVQCKELEAALPAGARIGTVDKFQGQEAPVVIYSMTCSTAEDAPRGMAFLYELERFNVAVSRAQGMTVLVCAPALLDPTCHNVEQVRMVSALCAFVAAASQLTF